jgi:hypothetical protein
MSCCRAVVLEWQILKHHVWSRVSLNKVPARCKASLTLACAKRRQKLALNDIRSNMLTKSEIFVDIKSAM